MLTLIRPEKSTLSDQIERQLKSVSAAYQVIHKEVSNIPYLVVAGMVLQGKAIVNYLDKYHRDPMNQGPDETADRF